MLGFGDLGVAVAYVSAIGATLLCIIYGLAHWNDDEELPSPVHPAGENLDFEEEV